MFKKILVIVSITISCIEPFAQKVENPPAWADTAIWYQIFVERFRNGDPNNDPTIKNMNIPGLMQYPQNWKLSNWTSDWYARSNWEEQLGKGFQETLAFRRYGGDLQGVIDQLPYLKNLGINAIYLNPINHAPSLHKYDASSYHHIDVHFGPDPEGDLQIMASENPGDPSTWKWTKADLLFLSLLEKAHAMGIRVIVDFSWNHTGTLFWAWQDVVKNQQQSKFKDWYDILSWDNPSTSENEFKYHGWLNIPSLPELKKVNIQGTRKTGYPYIGDIHPEVKKHIFAASQRWLAPNGDQSKGVDGFRLDVADHIGTTFWKDYRKFVRSINPQAYLIGEIWWAEWPDSLMDPAPYMQGDIFDAVMFYQTYRPARYYFAKTDFSINHKQLQEALNYEWSRIPERFRKNMMNVSSSHDAPRLLSDFYNPNKYKFQATPNDNPNYKTGKPDAATYQRVKLYLLHHFTTLGAPHIWNGEEMGMWGGDDPHGRKPLWWKDLNFEPETRDNYTKKTNFKDPVGFDESHFTYYQQLIQIRKSEKALQHGIIEFKDHESIFAYSRKLDDEEVLVLCNANQIVATYDLPKQSKWINLMNNQVYEGKSIKLEPISGLILKRIRQ